MRHQKIVNLSNETNNSKFVTRKCNIVSDQPNTNCNEGNEVVYNIEVLSLICVITTTLTF